jgi:hypothetical protein
MLFFAQVKLIDIPVGEGLLGRDSKCFGRTYWWEQGL